MSLLGAKAVWDRRALRFIASRSEVSMMDVRALGPASEMGKAIRRLISARFVDVLGTESRRLVVSRRGMKMFDAKEQALLRLGGQLG